MVASPMTVALHEELGDWLSCHAHAVQSIARTVASAAPHINTHQPRIHCSQRRDGSGVNMNAARPEKRKFTINGFMRMANVA